MSKEWLELILNLLVKNILKLYLPVNRLGKSGKDVVYYVRIVSNFASMRMMFLVWSSGQSNRSALMVFSSSVPSANS